MLIVLLLASTYLFVLHILWFGATIDTGNCYC